jgi:flagellar hook assembly protein FlgD
MLRPGKGKILWDGKSETGIPVRSGTYFFRVIAGKDVQTGKIVILR